MPNALSAASAPESVNEQVFFLTSISKSLLLFKDLTNLSLYLEKNKIHIDVYAIDCTYTFLTTNYGGHMNLLQNVKMKDRLEKIGAFDKNSRMIATHIAMAGQATHKELVKKAKKFGIEVAYDGMRVKI